MDDSPSQSGAAVEEVAKYECATCGQILASTTFTRKQLRKGNSRRCGTCLEEAHRPAAAKLNRCIVAGNEIPAQPAAGEYTIDALLNRAKLKQFDQLSSRPCTKWKQLMLSALTPRWTDVVLEAVAAQTHISKAPEIFAAAAAIDGTCLRVKELLEAAAVFRLAWPFFSKSVDECAVVYDACAGHGLLGLLFALRCPELKVVCIDIDRRSAFDKYLAAVESTLEGKGTLVHLHYESQDINEVVFEAGAFVLCVHGCNDLTKVVLSKAREVDASGFAIMPCCGKENTYDCSISSAIGGARYSCLVGLIGGQYGARHIKVMDDRISPRNLLLIG